MREPFHVFGQLVHQLVVPTLADEALIMRLFEPVDCPKGETLVTIGKVATHMYFINAGFVRAYHVEDGNEITNHLGSPGSFITAYTSFTTKAPADEAVVSLTACQLLRITKDNLATLYRESHNLALFGLFMADQYLVFNNQRGRDLITLSAEQRYLKLLEQQPAIIQTIPLQYIASYIGVKPESLSRIRRQLIS